MYSSIIYIIYKYIYSYFIHICTRAFTEYACMYNYINTQSFKNFRAFEEDAEQIPHLY